MSKKFTLEEVNEKLKQKNIVAKNYISILKPMDVKCLTCGHEWTTQANVLLNNVCGCPKCKHKEAGKKLRLTKEGFLASCGKFESDIIMVGDYNGFQVKTQFHCNDCGYDWETTPYLIRKFKTCPNCTGNRKLTHDEYVERVNKTHSDKYEVLSEYKSLSKKIKIKHISCGYIFETDALNFIGTGKKKACNCPKCSHGSVLRTTDEFKELLYKKDPSYTVIGEYTGNLKKIEIKHSCGTIINKAPYYILNRELLCPKCDRKRIRMSLGERRVYDYLTENNIHFISQYKISECKDIKPLPFDFAILDDTNNLISLIEYDGSIHFKYSTNKNSTFNYENFLRIVAHDNIKNKYCYDNNIPLLRIKYTEFKNISSILDSFLQ